MYGHMCPHIQKGVREREREKEIHLLIKEEALDQTKRMAREMMRAWQTKVNRWYPIPSKRIHMAVTVPRIPADSFLFFHNNTSAAAPIKYHQLQHCYIHRLQNDVWMTKLDCVKKTKSDIML
jgi:uncharacterized protein YecE (DUF72 family)